MTFTKLYIIVNKNFTETLFPSHYDLKTRRGDRDINLITIEKLSDNLGLIKRSKYELYFSVNFSNKKLSLSTLFIFKLIFVVTITFRNL